MWNFLKAFGLLLGRYEVQWPTRYLDWSVDRRFWRLGSARRYAETRRNELGLARRWRVLDLKTNARFH